MKNTLKLFGILVFVLALGGCSDDDNNPITQAKSFISGTFGGMNFFVDPLPNSRSASGSLSQLQGKVKSGNNIYGINGIYDEETGNFVLSGGAANAGFQIYGFRSGNDFIGTGYNRIKTAGSARSLEDTSSWDEFSNPIVFAESNDPGAINTTAATSLPSKWFGKWDYCKPENAWAVEEWYTSWGEPGDFCLVITPQGIRVLVNMERMEADIDEFIKQNSNSTPAEIANFKKEMLELYYNMNYDINVLEVDWRSDFEYHVIVSCIAPDNYSSSGDIIYRKISFTQTETGLNATLAIFELDSDGYGRYSTDDINEARNAIDFRMLKDFGVGENGEEVAINLNTLEMTRF